MGRVREAQDRLSPSPAHAPAQASREHAPLRSRRHKLRTWWDLSPDLHLPSSMPRGPLRPPALAPLDGVFLVSLGLPSTYRVKDGTSRVNDLPVTAGGAARDPWPGPLGRNARPAKSTRELQRSRRSLAKPAAEASNTTGPEPQTCVSCPRCLVARFGRPRWRPWKVSSWCRWDCRPRTA